MNSIDIKQFRRGAWNVTIIRIGDRMAWLYRTSSGKSYGTFVENVKPDEVPDTTEVLCQNAEATLNELMSEGKLKD